MYKNSKTINFIFRTGKTLSFIIDNFESLATLLVRILFYMPIEFITTARMRLVTIMRMKKVRLLFTIRSTLLPIQTISSRTIKATYQFRQLVRNIVTIDMFNPITIIGRVRERLSSTIYQGKLEVLIDALLVELFTLGDYDPETLLDMDSETLGDLDYIIL